MKNKSSNLDQSRIITQLRRISGQVDGIIKMIENERECIDIVNQILAARNSLSTVGNELLVSKAKFCSKDADYDQLESILKKLIKN
jgi:DNA-binding FrmR family transcriptional regulator